MIPKRILKLKAIKHDPDFTKYHNEYKINYDSWIKLSIEDRIKILQIVKSNNHYDLSKLKYNILPYDLKQKLDKITIEVF